MSKAAFTIKAFGVYLLCLGIIVTFAPNQLLSIKGRLDTCNRRSRYQHWHLLLVCCTMRSNSLLSRIGLYAVIDPGVIRNLCRFWLGKSHYHSFWSSRLFRRSLAIPCASAGSTTWGCREVVFGRICCNQKNLPHCQTMLWLAIQIP